MQRKWLLYLFMSIASFLQSIHGSRAMLPPATMRPYDLLIDELMIDPSPSVGLPANEWIEIKNTTNEALDLQDCRIGYNQMQTGPLPAFVLLPGITVILCAGSAVNAMAAFGPAL